MTQPSLQVAASAERTLARLPDRVAVAVVKFMLGPLLETPERVGAPLQRELSGYRSARRGAYRIVYRIIDEESVVRVVRTEHRAPSTEHRADVYRNR